MLPLLIVIGLLALMGGAAFLVMRNRTNERMRERLTFGFQEIIEEEVEDLSAGDYGLTGRERFYYHLQRFFESTSGRLSLAGGGAGAAALFGLISQMKLQQIATFSVAGGLGTLLIAMTMLSLRTSKRERMIRKELPNVMEMMAAIMEGGLAFEASLGHILRESDPKHPLFFDLNVVSEAMRRGRRRSEALRLWAERCNLAQIADVTSGLIQADQTGSSLGSVLRHHGQALMRDNEAEIQRRAERLPIRMLMPMMLTILPSVIIVAALPSFLKVIRVMEEIMGGATGMVK